MRAVNQVREHVGRPTAIVLSPHSDDAAFSLAGTLKALLDAGTAVRILTLFSRSAFALNGGRDAEVVTRMRQEEDRSFNGLLGPACLFEWMGLPEANLRGLPLNAVLTERAFTADEEVLRDQIANAVRPLLTSDAAVYLPLGIGSHVDHRIVRDAGIAAATASGATLCFYEDLPYAALYSRKSLASLDAIVQAVAMSLHIALEARYVSFSELIAFKQAAARCYRSQLSARWLEGIVRHAAAFDGTNGAERLWQAA